MVAFQASTCPAALCAGGRLGMVLLQLHVHAGLPESSGSGIAHACCSSRQLKLPWRAAAGSTLQLASPHHDGRSACCTSRA